MPIAVNGEMVDDQSIRDGATALKERLRAEHPKADPLSLELQAHHWARENVIMQVLLRQAAGSSSPKAFQSEIMAQAARPRPREVASYYREFSKSFISPETIRVAHIIKNIDESATEAEAEFAIRAAEQMLKEGVEFAQVADRHSDCPGEGVDLGFFARGQMVEEFSAVVFALRPGETSGVFRSLFGFHIATLLERREPRLLSLNEVRQQIEEDLWSQRKQRKLAEFMEDLRARAEVKRL